MTLKKFINKELGIMSTVTKHDKGWCIQLYDTDAQETLTHIRIYPEFQCLDAILLAKKWANV